MEIIYFVVTAIVLYFLSGWILDRIESHMGRRLEQRSVVYFFILLTLAVITFYVIERFAPPL